MTLVVIFGPAAVGKMTVGMELERLTGMRLNETPLRLAEKKPKRDLANSRVHLLDADRRYQLNTQGAFFYPELHPKIENTALTPVAVAQRIIQHFALRSRLAG